MFCSVHDENKHPVCVIAGIAVCMCAGRTDSGAATGGISFVPLEYDYTTQDWFATPINARKVRAFRVAVLLCGCGLPACSLQER